MMMPANYSAVAENEMTYVVGGAVALGDILADKLDVSNWKKFNSNMVTLIGNAYLGGFIDNTAGVIFGGNYTPFATVRGYVHNLGSKGLLNFDSFGAGAKSVLNIGLNLVGNAAAVYNLATGTVANAIAGARVYGHDNATNKDITGPWLIIK